MTTRFRQTEMVLGNMSVRLRLHAFALLTAISMLLIACGSLEHVHTFPTHGEPLPTDWGRGDHIMVDLIVEDGCLRTGGPSPSYLLILPDGYTLSQTEDSTSVSDRDGRSVARVGDTVRFSGRLIDPDSELAREIADSVPEECSEPYYLVGDEVRAIPSDESEIVSVPGSSLYFQRKKNLKRTVPAEDTLELASGPFELMLVGNCLVVNYYNERVVPLWPAGFYPYIGGDGVIEVRNGGGRTIARVGDMLLMRGTPVGESRIPHCSARLLNVKDVRNASLPIVFPRHDQEIPGYRNHIIGLLLAYNGCLYVRGNILILPSDFSVNETDTQIQILNQDNVTVGRVRVDDPIGSSQASSFTGRRVNQDDNLGRQLRRTLPIDCPHSDFWLAY